MIWKWERPTDLYVSRPVEELAELCLLAKIEGETVACVVSKAEVENSQLVRKRECDVIELYRDARRECRPQKVQIAHAAH